MKDVKVVHDDVFVYTEPATTLAFWPNGTDFMHLGGVDDAPVIIDFSSGEVIVRGEADLSEAARTFWNAVRAMSNIPHPDPVGLVEARAALEMVVEAFDEGHKMGLYCDLARLRRAEAPVRAALDLLRKNRP